MSLHNINEIKEMFAKDDYDLERNSNNSRQFFVKKFSDAPDVDPVVIRCGLKIDDFYETLVSLGTENFIKEFQSGSTRTKTTVRSTINPNSKIKNGEQTPNALKRRRKHAEKQPDVVNDVQLTEVSTYVHEAKGANELDENLAAAFISKKINYDIRIPKKFDGYYFPIFTSAVLRRIEIGRNVFLSGPSGTGKTEFVLKLGECISQKVVRVNFNVGTTEQHLIGKWTVKDGQTEFVYGILPLAMKFGWWILFDEIDFAMPEHMAVLQPVLEGEPLLVTLNKNEEIIPHENFRVFATGNTKGRGDETQSYVGTGNLNLAFLDRWAIFEMDYTDKERDIVKSIIHEKTLAKQICEFF